MIHNFFGSQLDLKLLQWPKSNFFLRNTLCRRKLTWNLRSDLCLSIRNEINTFYTSLDTNILKSTSFFLKKII